MHLVSSATMSSLRQASAQAVQAALPGGARHLTGTTRFRVGAPGSQQP
jgi:hypothetical protein